MEGWKEMYCQMCSQSAAGSYCSIWRRISSLWNGPGKFILNLDFFFYEINFNMWLLFLNVYNSTLLLKNYNDRYELLLIFCQKPFTSVFFLSKMWGEIMKEIFTNYKYANELKFS